jgi:hypothetical protein
MNHAVRSVDSDLTRRRKVYFLSLWKVKFVFPDVDKWPSASITSISYQSMDEKSLVSSFFLQSFLFDFVPALFSLLDVIQYLAKLSCFQSFHGVFPYSVWPFYIDIPF